MRTEQPPPWERKEKERKYERGGGSGLGSGPSSAGDGFGGGGAAAASTTPRWREPYHGPASRDFSRGSPRRPPSGHHRLYPEDSPSRSDRFWADDDRRQQQGRDSRGSFRRSPYFNSSPSSDFPRRSPHELPIATGLRSVAVPISTTTTAQPKDQTDADRSLGPISWKPLKWARPISQLSSKEDPGLRVSVPPDKETAAPPAVSPMISPQNAEEGASKKKARLGWGQGLAKYEKEKVQGSADTSNSGPAITASCTSPATPTPFSATSRPSSVLEEGPPASSANPYTDKKDENAPEHETQAQPSSTDFSIKLDNLETDSVGSLATLLANLLQTEDAYSGDSTFANKMSLLKVDISKELEKTESEIDSLELKLKSLDSDPPNTTSADSTCKTCLDSSEVALNEKQDTKVVDVKMEDSNTRVEDISMDFIEPSSSGNCANDSSILEENNTVDNLISVIISSNQESAKRASEAFDRVSWAGLPRANAWDSSSILCHRRHDQRVRDKIVKRKRTVKFKERALALKFMALRQLWKEDLRLLSVKKNGTKTGKRPDLTGRSSQNSSQKLRASVRSRLSMPVANPTLVPSTEILEYTGKLLSDSQIKLYRSNLKMPALILDKEERKHSRFITKNGLVEDPPSFEQGRSMINPWTEQEISIFKEMLATYGKDFTKISSFLSHKSTADCIEFYYKNHKSDGFAEVKERLKAVKKQSQFARSNTYLVTSDRKWSRESSSAAALDLLGVAAAAYNQFGSKGKHKAFVGKSGTRNYQVQKSSRGTHGSSSAADVLLSMGRAQSSEAMSSCVTSSTDPAGRSGYKEKRRLAKRDLEEEDACSDESCDRELVSTDWTDGEKSEFVQALSTYGKDFAKISQCLGTRTKEQCKAFFSKAKKSLGLERNQEGGNDGDVNGPPPGNGDTNGGRSDTEDACAAEIDSAICSNQSCSKVTGDVNATGEGPVQAGTDRSGEQEEVAGGAAVDSMEVDGFSGKQETAPLNIDDDSSRTKDELVSEDKPRAYPVPDETANDANVTRLPEIVEEQAEARPETDTEGIAPERNKIESVSCTSGTVEQKEEKSENSAAAAAIVVVKKEAVLHHSLPPPLETASVVTGTARVRRRASIDLGSASSVICFAQDPGVSGNVLSRPASVTPSYSHHQNMIRPEILPYMLKENLGNNSLPLNQQFGSVFSNPSAICFNNGTPPPSQTPIPAAPPHVVPSRTTLNFEEHLHKQQANLQPVNNSKDLYQQYNMTVSQPNQPLHVLKGYPLQIPNHKDMKSETDLLLNERSLSFESHLKRSEPSQSQSNQFFQLKKQAQLGGAAGILFAPKADNKCEITRPSPDSELQKQSNGNRTGDVKLFGKILNQSSSSEKANNTVINESKVKENGSFICRPVSDSGGSSDSNHLGLDGVPVRSYGFWDGSRIQTGFSSLPESALMMSKYQESLAGVLPFYPGNNSNNNIINNNSSNPSVQSSSNINLASYQQPHMQQLSSNGKRMENFTVMPKRSGIEMVQHVGGNLVGSGPGLNGHHNGAVSDPVAALKLHFASSAKVCGSTSSMESWRGDIGGR